jgi:hypothetical protein
MHAQQFSQLNIAWLYGFSVMIDRDGYSMAINLSNAAMQQCIDTPLALPWGADLTQNAIEKKQ